MLYRVGPLRIRLIPLEPGFIDIQQAFHQANRIEIRQLELLGVYHLVILDRYTHYVQVIRVRHRRNVREIILNQLGGSRIIHLRGHGMRLELNVYSSQKAS